MTVLSPTFLPGFNLMLDVPALALSLFALTLFFRAVSCYALRAIVLAVLAGLVAGLAMQTKYTGSLAPAIMLLAAIFGMTRPHHLIRRAAEDNLPSLAHASGQCDTGPKRERGMVSLAARLTLRHPLAGRLLLWLIAASMAGIVFASWEIFVAYQHGESHFLYHLRNQGLSVWGKVYLFPPLLTLAGGVASALIPLGLAALRLPRWVVALAGALVSLAYVLVAVVPASNPVSYEFCFNFAVFGTLGVAIWGIVAAVAFFSRRRIVCICFGFRISSFGFGTLLCWLVVEITGYVALTPFLAVRRIMGIVIVLTLLIGWLAARTCRSPGRRRLVWCVAIFGMLLGFGFYTLDLLGAAPTSRPPRKPHDGSGNGSVHPESGTSATGVFSTTPNMPAWWPLNPVNHISRKAITL